jgi:hypothetical protein
MADKDNNKKCDSDNKSLEDFVTEHYQKQKVAYCFSFEGLKVYRLKRFNNMSDRCYCNSGFIPPVNCGTVGLSPLWSFLLKKP